MIPIPSHLHYHTPFLGIDLRLVFAMFTSLFDHHHFVQNQKCCQQFFWGVVSTSFLPSTDIFNAALLFQSPGAA